MNSSKIVSCGLSHHVRFPPFNRCRLLIFCLPNKSCMFLHVNYSQIFSNNICQTEGCILLCSLSQNTNNHTAQNIHCIYPHHKAPWNPGLQRVPNLVREGDYFNAMQKILFCCRTFRAKLPYVPPWAQGFPGMF